MEQSWDALRAHVCRKCIDGDGRGNCRLAREESCALQAFHPEVFSLINALESDSYDAFVQALRARICSVCEHQTPEGVCLKRQTLECALDRYYPLVINVAESLLAETQASSPLEAALNP
ncbi:MAG: hypothetical protein HY562_09115 [Ignavibacteriales bacterium]|nr:hypothetical protein [Ignavibacteriales bacterium]